MVDLTIQLELTRSLDSKANFQQVLGDALKAIFGEKEAEAQAAPESFEELQRIVAGMG